MSTRTHAAASGRTVVRREDETVLALAKGLAIIELFDGTRTRLTAAEAAKAVGASRAAARRCLLTLATLGYVTRHAEEAYFTPRARLMRLGRGYASSTTFLNAAQALLNETRDVVDDPVALAVRDGAEVLFLARAAVTRVVTTGVNVGGRLPVFCSATGRMLISELEVSEQKRLLADAKRVSRTPKTVRNEATLLKILGQVRNAGVAYCDEELEIGMRSLAVPVRGENGTIRATVSSSALSARVALSTLSREREPALRDAARRMSELLSDFGPDALPY